MGHYANRTGYRLGPHVMGIYEEGDGIAAWAGELR